MIKPATQKPKPAKKPSSVLNDTQDMVATGNSATKPEKTGHSARPRKFLKAY